MRGKELPTKPEESFNGCMDNCYRGSYIRRQRAEEGKPGECDAMPMTPREEGVHEE